MLLCDRVITLADWGFPLGILDLHMLVKAYLERQGTVVPCFKDNVPGYDWGVAFLKRHRYFQKTDISEYKD